MNISINCVIRKNNIILKEEKELCRTTVIYSERILVKSELSFQEWCKKVKR